MRILDRLLSVLLILGAAAHTFGVLQFYRRQPDALFWSLSAGILIAMVAAVNLLRSWRPGDHLIAWIAAVFSAAYFVVTIGFGRLIGDLADPRVIGFGVISIALFLFGVTDALVGKRPNSYGRFK